MIVANAQLQKASLITKYAEIRKHFRGSVW
jgi:hypothetical protein